MSYQITDIVNRAKVSQVIVERDIAICKLKGISHPNEQLPEILYEVRTSIEWKFDKSPNDLTLFETSNYLNSICIPIPYIAQHLGFDYTLDNTFTL